MGITTAYNLTPFTGLVDTCNGAPGALRQPDPEFNTSLWTQHLTPCGKSEYPWRAEQDPGEVTPGLAVRTLRACPLAGLVSLPEPHFNITVPFPCKKYGLLP